MKVFYEFGEPGGERAGIDGCGALKASGTAEILQTPESVNYWHLAALL